MGDLVLVLNAGSSSLKFSAYRHIEGDEWRLELRDQIEGPKASPHAHDWSAALSAFSVRLQTLPGAQRVAAVGHRVVHGGSLYEKPTIVTPQVLAQLHALIPLAPLHQPHNIAAMEAVAEWRAGVPQVACFDTSFHRTQSRLAQLIPLPDAIRRRGVQRYGFHGLSYEYIASALPKIAPAIANRRVIVAHLGNGASLCAIKEGKSLDCTMGFTALDGLCMGTRAGSLDPGAVLYLFQNLGLSANEVEAILYRESGLLGISGFSGDMRDLLASTQSEARLAVDYFVFRASKEIAALAAVTGGVDGLVFTAGIGENSAEIRRRICESLEWLGLKLDVQANSSGGPRISSQASRVSAWVIPTNEELMIARHTGALLGLTKTS
ncbi:MAG TPA: acetate/propionate family kinase [Bryobacteraceae bacterium]|nr:acetate/propionate family kinase [Bryobacteraceae bacterium]